MNLGTGDTESIHFSRRILDDDSPRHLWRYSVASEIEHNETAELVKR